MSYFADKLKAAREAAGYNQADFAAAIGEIVTNYSNIENDRRRFPKSKYEQAEKLLGLDESVMKVWQTLSDLTEDEMKKLASEMAEKIEPIMEKAKKGGKK